MLRKLVLFVFLVFSYAGLAIAADGIGFIDGTAIMKKYEGSIEAKLKDEFKAKDEEMMKLQKALVDKTETYTRENAMMSDEEKLAFQQDFEKKQMEFQTKATEMNQERMKRSNEELEKLLNKVKAASQKVAEEKKFEIVLQSGAGVYFDKSLDVTQEVIAELDKK